MRSSYTTNTDSSQGSLQILREFSHATSLSQYQEKSGGRFFTVILFAFIVFFLLITLFVGMQVYSFINSSREASDDTRLGLSLITNSVRMNDAVDAIGVGNGPQGNALVLTERLDSGSYETRIYLYQGMIVEEYAIAESPYTPAKARELVESDSFEFDYANGLLSIYTDQGTAYVAIHSKGGSS